MMNFVDANSPVSVKQFYFINEELDYMDMLACRSNLALFLFNYSMHFLFCL